MQRYRVQARIGAEPIWIAVFMWLCSCATVFSASGQDIKVTSNVEGATVLLDGESIGETPLEFYIERDTFKRHELTLTHEDHKSRTIILRKTLNSVALSNCTFLLSWGTDALTGAMMEYSPSAYFVELQPKKGERALRDRELMLFLVASSNRVLGDIARGGGEALGALETLTGVEAHDRQAFRGALLARFGAMATEEWPTGLYAHVIAAHGAGRQSRALPRVTP